MTPAIVVNNKGLNMASIRERYKNRAAMVADEIEGEEIETIKNNLEDMRTNARRFIDRLNALSAKHLADAETVADIANIIASSANWVDYSKL